MEGKKIRRGDLVRFSGPYLAGPTSGWMNRFESLVSDVTGDYVTLGNQWVVHLCQCVLVEEAVRKFDSESLRVTCDCGKEIMLDVTRRS